MKQIVTTLCLLWGLSGCAILLPDCGKLGDKPDEYRTCRANQGDKQSQYERGLIYYEKADYKNALKWLKLAASAVSGKTAIYMPPVGGQKYGTVMNMDSGMASSGHNGAKRLLANMYERGLGVKPDPEEAEKWRSRIIYSNPL